ncbi:MAG: extracellular solute-binding protein [Spirochaetia bacterium]|nr:extracellular solute-binding protein [Spirochaetia bacterium]MCF7942759.1 extracellular solute-binding protein [Spirochaetia bacterium]
MNTKRFFCTLLILLIAGVSIFAGGQSETKNDMITLKMGDNLPDRTVTWGAVSEEINTEFIAQHPNVRFEVESYQDQAYQEKIKIYATAGQLPDIMKYWSFSTLLHPLAKNNLVEPLDPADFADMGWLPGALESNMYDGKLYGIPVSGDLWVLYYNESILEECGVAVPSTISELVEASRAIEAKGYIPVVTDGKDGWPLSITFDNIFWRVTGDYSLMTDALNGKKSFKDPEFLAAAQAYQDLFYNSGVFGNDTVTMDYGASRNLFGQQQAAMYIMGSWELGLASDTNFSDEFREHVRAAKFPLLASGNGNEDDLVAWFGGNYIVNASSKHKDLAIDYLKLYAELYPSLVWERQAGFPAQKVAASENDTPVAKDLLAIAAAAKATSGTTSLDMLTPEFKETHQKLCKDLAAGIITPVAFCNGLDTAFQKTL